MSDISKPFMSLHLSARQVWTTRDKESETREMVFTGKALDNFYVNEKCIETGTIKIFEGRYLHEGRDIIGGISFSEAWSHENHIEPATFYIRVWVSPITFEAIRMADLETTQIRMNFQFNAKDENTVTKEREFGISWDAEVEHYIDAESFNVAMRQIEKKSEPEQASEVNPTGKNNPLTSFETEILAELRSTRKYTLWCFCAVFALILAVLMKM